MLIGHVNAPGCAVWKCNQRWETGLAGKVKAKNTNVAELTVKYPKKG